MRTELAQPKNYRGSIRYSKGTRHSRGYFKGTSAGYGYFVEKNRPFRSEEYGIPEEDYNWCDSYKKASALWAYYHYYGTAFHYEGKNIHPRTGEKYNKGEPL